MKFQLVLILPEPFFLVVLIPACGDVALFFDVCNGGGVTPASDEILTNPASANELCFLQIHGALCTTEDGLCLTVNGSSRVKRRI